MAIVVADRVKVRARTTGTGPFTVESTFPGFQGFEAVGDGNETYYGIFDVAGNWEVGQGTYTASGQTLSRDVIIASSNSGSVVDFPDGGKTLYVTVPSTILTTLAGAIPNSFLNVAVAGQTTITADSPTDVLTVAAGTGIAITTDAVTDTLTITSTATTSDSFKNIVVAGQSTVIADNSADTLTLVAGDNITITTDAASDTITITGADAGDVLPSQTGNAGKYLTTDGSSLSWGVVATEGGGGGGGGSFDFTVAADDSTMVVINAGETLKIIGGDGITTASNAEGAITVTASFSGSYLDLLNRPSIPVSLLDLGISDGINGQVLTTNGFGTFSFQSITTGLATVATTGSYTDLINKPTIPSTIFSTVAVSGQSNIVADSTTDTLTIAAGTGITITTDALSDTITITNSSADTTYTVSAETVAGGANLRLTGSDASTDDVKFAAGTDITIVRTDANTITINSTAAGGDIGSFVFLGTNIDTDDSSGITITPSVTIQSDLTIENELTVNNLTTINGQLAATDIYFTGSINSQGSGTPEIYSDNEILLTAGTRVSLTGSPIKMASFSTAERDVLVAENGDMIYNSTTNKFQGYANGTWVDLH